MSAADAFQRRDFGTSELYHIRDVNTVRYCFGAKEFYWKLISKTHPRATPGRHRTSHGSATQTVGQVSYGADCVTKKYPYKYSTVLDTVGDATRGV